MSFIDKLQKKTLGTRMAILWAATIFVMAIIVVFWLFSFSNNLNTRDVKDQVEQTQLPSLFESIEKDISTFKQGLDASVENIKEQISSQSIDEINLEQK